MASGSYAISGLNLEPVKREFKVRANRKTARAGDVIKFTITATGVSDRTVRSYYIDGVGPEDLSDAKTNGLFYLREGKAEVYVQISEEYDRDKDQVLVFNVVDKVTTLLKIRRPAQAKVVIKGDGETNDEQRRQKRQKRLEGRKSKQLKGRNSKSLPPGKGGLARQDPIYPVSVREVAPKALKAGYKALPGISGQKALPATAPRALPPVGMKALPPAGMKALPASKQIIDITPISKSVTPMGGALAKGGAAAGGGALAKGAAGAAAKGARGIPGVNLLTAGMEFGSRMESGQNLAQAGIGTAASVAGGAAGATKGAAVGAALGSVVPGLGTAIGGLLGAVIGGVGGSMLAGGAADAVTGANRQEFAEGGHIIPKMTDMPFNLPGLAGSFNEPGNPEMLSITPLDDPMKAVQSVSGIAQAAGVMAPGLNAMVPGLGMLGGANDMLGGLFGGKKKEYEGIADAIGENLEDRGIGDPFGLKGSKKSYGNMTRDMFASAMGESLKKIFGGMFGGGGGAPGAGGGGGVPSGGGSPAAPGSQSAGEAGLLKALRFAEGTEKSYGTIFGGNVIKELEEGKLTVQEVINVADTGRLPARLGGGAVPGYGSGSKATGAYQFMPFTLEGLIQSGDLKPDELFTNEVQDRAALALARRRGVTSQMLATEGFSQRISSLLAPEWASLPTASGRSYYGQPVKTLAELQQKFSEGSQAFQQGGGMNSPTTASGAPQAAPGAGGPTVVLAAGTNDFMDPVKAGRNAMLTIQNLKAKGYNVVVVPPNKVTYGPAHNAVKSAAKNENVIVEEGIYEKFDPLHLTPGFASKLNAKYPDAIFMGDSNAARIAGDRGKANIRREGAGTGEILQYAQQLQRAAPAAAQPAVAARPQTQLNAGYQQMSYNTTSGAAQQPAQMQAASPYAPTAQTEVLAGPGTFIQGNTGRSDGDHFHIGPELELWNKPEGKTEARRAAFKVAKGLIAKKEQFWFTNADIMVDGNNPPDDATLMKYVEREQAAHAARSGGGSFGGLDIAGRDGLTMPIGVSDVRDRGDGFGISGTISGTRAFVGHGRAGSTATPGTATMMAGQTSSNGTMAASSAAPQGPPPGNPEDFFAFAAAAQGLEYQAPPGASTTPENIMHTSAQTAMASNKPAVTVVNTPVSNTSVTGGGGGGQQVYSGSTAGGPISDAGLLAYMAQQQLMTIGA